VLDATPSPSSATSRVAMPLTTITPDVIVASSTASSVPSPAGSDTSLNADSGATPLKRPRLHSTKSELFIVGSETCRDTTTDTDGSCDAPVHIGVSHSVAPVVTAVSDDSVDSTSVTDMSQNSVMTVVCQTSIDSFADKSLSSADADTQSATAQVCTCCIYWLSYFFLLGCIECMQCMRCSSLLPMFAVFVSLSVTWLNSASLCKNG